MTATLLAFRVNSRQHLQVFIQLTAKMTNRTPHRGFYAISDLYTLIHTPWLMLTTDLLLVSTSKYTFINAHRTATIHCNKNRSLAVLLLHSFNQNFFQAHNLCVTWHIERQYFRSTPKYDRKTPSDTRSHFLRTSKKWCVLFTISFIWRDSPQWARASSLRGF
jgi:hypothetical protein